MLLYLSQEGRGIGLLNKLRAYKLQEEGLDTVDANIKLGLPADLRDYGIGAQILGDLGLTSIRILTNNPKKILGLEGYGLSVTEQVPIRSVPNPHNEAYLEAKRDKLGHTLHHQGLALDEQLLHEEQMQGRRARARRRADRLPPDDDRSRSSSSATRTARRSARLEFAVCVATFYEDLAERLLNGAAEGFDLGGVSEASVHTYRVPGAFELPFAAKLCAESGRFAGIACLGVVIRGETSHYDHVCEETARGIQTGPARHRRSLRLRRDHRGQHGPGRSPARAAASATRAAAPRSWRCGWRCSRARWPERLPATITRLMAKVCHSCGKKPAFGNSRSHSMVATRRRFNPNLQKVRIRGRQARAASTSARAASSPTRSRRPSSLGIIRPRRDASDTAWPTLR